MTYLYMNRHRGMTFVEMIVVVSVVTILSIAITSSVAALYRLNAYTIAQANQVAHARRGVEFLVRDVREMTYADDGTFPLAAMEEGTIGFYSDIDADDSVEYIEYELDGTVFSKRIFNATGTVPSYPSVPDETIVVSEYVQNELQDLPVFTYYDASGEVATSSASITDVRYVQVEIVVNIDPVRDPNEFALRGSATLRNLQ